MALGLDSWWHDPDYKACRTLEGRGRFIIMKLVQLDTQKLQAAWFKAFPGQTIFEPARAVDLTKAQWQTILESMGGASPEEIRDVQQRMGRVWQ